MDLYFLFFSFALDSSDYLDLLAEPGRKKTFYPYSIVLKNKTQTWKKKEEEKKGGNLKIRTQDTSSTKFK